MAVYTQFAAETVLVSAFASLGEADLILFGTPTPSRLVLAAVELETVFIGQGLQFSQTTGLFTGGTVNTLEVYYKGGLLFRFEQIAVPATVLNDQSIFEAALTGADTIVGSPLRDQLFGGGGADLYRAGGGDDDMYGTAGSDQYEGGTGLDQVLYDARLSQAVITPVAPNRFTVKIDALPVDTLTDVEYLSFTDQRISLLDLALGTPAPNDDRGTEVYRFAKVDSGQYFYTGSRAERDQILASLPNFRFEGAVFKAQDNLTDGYSPVFRFANLDNGGYFYTASAAERDQVFSNYPQYRYEGVSFYVATQASPDTIPVYRLANVLTGGYLYTASVAEYEYAITLPQFRDEGFAFNSPRSIVVASSPNEADLAQTDSAAIELAGLLPATDLWQG